MWSLTGFAVIAVALPLRLSLAGSGDKKFTYVDLKPHSNQKLSDNFGSGREGNNLVDLPVGEQAFKGVKFKIEDGLIQLGSNMLKKEKPKKVEGIKVGRTFTKLHLLHATVYGLGSDGDPTFVPDDTQIAEYKVHYEEAPTETIPVVYGKDVRDWWFADNSNGVTRGKVAWKGNSDLAKSFGLQIRLYLSTWQNPHPAKRVARIDYVKVGDTPAAHFALR
jgi:hypothetical protein